MNLISNLFNPAQLHQEITAASPPDFWFHASIAVMVAAAGFVFAFVFFKRARIIEDTPTSKIRSAAQGYVELVGYGDTLEGPDIIAPLSKTACTWYRYRVEKVDSEHERVVDSGHSEDLFVLVGKTGKCVIDPEGADVTPTIKRVWYGSSYQGDSSMMGNRYRFTEERMHPGDPIYAIGFFRSVGGSNDSFNESAEINELLKKWKGNQAMLLKNFDKNGDGKIDMKEWENIRKVAKLAVSRKRKEQAQQPVTHILSKPNTKGQPFLLSSKPQHQLTLKYKLFAAGSFAGFVLVGSFASWMFLIRF